MEELATASEVSLAVAFFNPSDGMLDALAKLPKTKAIVSEEFTITGARFINTCAE